MNTIILMALSMVSSELDETKRLAPKYEAEMTVILEDNTVCDLLTDKYAFEIDYAEKWYEAIGQALHYAIVSERKPAIILLLKNAETEWKYLIRCATVCGKYDIKLYVEPVK